LFGARRTSSHLLSEEIIMASGKVRGGIDIVRSIAAGTGSGSRFEIHVELAARYIPWIWNDET
jgi:hypothetical protein